MVPRSAESRPLRDIWVVALGTPSMRTSTVAAVEVPAGDEVGAEFVAAEGGDGAEFVVSVEVHEPVALPSGPCPEGFGGVGSVVEGLAADGGFEGVRGGVHGPGHCSVDQWQVLGCCVSCCLFAAFGVVHRDQVAVVRPVQAAQAGQFLVRDGLFQHQRVAAGDGFGLGEVQGVVPDVFDFPDVQAAAHDLVDEPGFAFQSLPHEGIEGFLGDDLGDADLGVLVALAQDAAVALLDVGRPPRGVHVHQVHGTFLNVRADTHFRC